MIRKFFSIAIPFCAFSYANVGEAKVGDERDVFYGLMLVAFHEKGNQLWQKVQQAKNPQTELRKLFNRFKTDSHIEENPFLLIDFRTLAENAVDELFRFLIFVKEKLAVTVRNKTEPEDMQRVTELALYIAQEYKDFTKFNKISFDLLTEQCIKLIHAIQSTKNTELSDLFAEAVERWNNYIKYERLVILSYIDQRAKWVDCPIIDDSKYDSGFWHGVKWIASVIAGL